MKPEPLAPFLASQVAPATLSPADRARAFRHLREFIAWFAENCPGRYCHIAPAYWYACVPSDRPTLLRDARSHELTLLVEGVDADDLIHEAKP